MEETIKILNDIEKACEFCERKFTQDEIFEALRSDDDKKKTICILSLETLNLQEEADLLVFHLTNHHGSVREPVANKINEFILNGKYNNLFQTKYAMDSFLLAINDINPNICRLVIEILPCIDEREYFINKLYERFEAVFEEIEKLKRNRLYTKKIFNLYWCLEALAVLNAPIDARFEAVICRAGRFREYTIREKAAAVVVNRSGESAQVDALIEALRGDSNFYVRRVFESKYS